MSENKKLTNWSDVIHLYNGEDYSVIWGLYQNGDIQQCVGVSWNASSEHNEFNNSLEVQIWPIIPNLFQKSILITIMNKVIKNPQLGDIDNIKKAMSEIVLKK